MIKTKQYHEWSYKFHNRYAIKPLTVQMEITYRCLLHCKHCYTDCYNKPSFTEHELPTKRLMQLIKQLRNSGVLWLNFTGGDPFMREDFVELYRYAKKLGFIISIKTSLSVLPENIFKTIENFPPFLIETTLNGASKYTYEYISQVNSSFATTLTNIKKILNAGLNLKINTLLSKNNLHEKEQLQNLIEGLGCKFYPTAEIFARLNGDTAPCKYRLSYEEIIGNKTGYKKSCNNYETEHVKDTNFFIPQDISGSKKLFRCPAGRWQWYIDTRGRLLVCNCLRKPSYNLMQGSIKNGIKRLSKYIGARIYKSNSKCKDCGIAAYCFSCPGKSRLESGNEESPILDFCVLANKFAQDSGALTL